MSFSVSIIGASSLLAQELLYWMDKWKFPFTDLHLYDNHNLEYTRQCLGSFYIIKAWHEQADTSHLYFICDKDYEEYFDDHKVDGFIISLVSSNSHHLIIPSMNISDVHDLKHVALPMHDVLTIAPILDVLQEFGKCNHCSLTSLKSMSEFGYDGMKELEQQIYQYSHHQPMEASIVPEVNNKTHLPVLFHPIPQCGKLMSNDDTTEEMDIQLQCDRISNRHIPIDSTCIRIGSPRGISFSLDIMTEEILDKDAIYNAFDGRSQFQIMDDYEHAIYPITCDVLHDYHIFIGRIRIHDHHLLLWCVSDDVSQRAASALQIGLYVYHNNIYKNLT